MSVLKFNQHFRSVVACWRQLARDENLSSATMENFLRLMTSIELYEDPYHITENHIAALQPLTVSYTDAVQT